MQCLEFQTQKQLKPEQAAVLRSEKKKCIFKNLIFPSTSSSLGLSSALLKSRRLLPVAALVLSETLPKPVTKQWIRLVLIQLKQNS